MTEVDARQMWCPFALALETVYEQTNTGTSGSIQLGSQTIPINFPGTFGSRVAAAVAVNRNGSGGPHTNCLCITTRCMAWRTILADPTRGHCARLGYVE